MKIITIRRAILFSFFLLLPIIQFYFSPFLSIRAAQSGGIAISVFVFLGLIFVGAFFGRAPCSWFMPCGGFQEACFPINNKRVAAGSRDKIKFFIWAPWLVSLIIILLLNAGRLHLDLLFAMPKGVSVANLYGYIPYYLVIILFFALCMIFGRRTICHYVCWMAPFMIIGRKLGNSFGLPGLRMKSDLNKCTGCKSCSKVCTMGIEVDDMVKSGNMEHAECIMCVECANACKSKAIEFSFCRNKKKFNEFKEKTKKT